MRARMGHLILGMIVMIFVSLRAGAMTGDVESSHDYPGFSRMPGFVITDYDEDNPGDFIFPVASPLPTDADHVDAIPITGHRYRIRYELSAGATAPTLMEMQQYYEKLAASEGFNAEKTGATGDVTETFHRVKGSHAVWVYLEPSTTAAVVTVVEVLLNPSSPVAVKPKSVPATASTGGVTVGPVPATGDTIESSLVNNGRVALPLNYLPGQPDLRADSIPMVNQVIKILLAHPDWHIVIEGHTDGTGYVQDNQFLSAQRARAVRELLVAGGIISSRITAIGLGGSQPVGDDRTDEGREQNRRTDLIVRKD